MRIYSSSECVQKKASERSKKTVQGLLVISSQIWPKTSYQFAVIIRIFLLSFKQVVISGLRGDLITQG